MKKLLLILFSISLVSCLSVSLTLDEGAAKSIADAIKESNNNVHIMKLSDSESADIEWVDDGKKKIRKVMIRGQRFGKGPNAGDYMDDIPENIKKRIQRARQKGIDIKIDTIISEDGTKKEIKIEVKSDNN
ncbi:MAG: hypothetical protein ISQ42_04010 [Flavobacteriaceae bacterium]|nr:hypothetical protein [Flavobacteriaceae bacterium]